MLSEIEEDFIVSPTRYPVFTVGHSNHALDTFLALLQKHGINEVVDVRSSPYSRYAPHFNRDVLAKTLGGVDEGGIKYVFMGGELGGRPADRSCYDAHGHVCYGRLANTDLFRRGIMQTIRIANEQRAVLMCSEKEPLDCHRTLLVARVLVEQGIVAKHILADGGLEEHTAAMNRLVDTRNGELFRTPDEVIDDALTRQAKRVGYVGKKSDSI